MGNKLQKRFYRIGVGCFFTLEETGNHIRNIIPLRSYESSRSFSLEAISFALHINIRRQNIEHVLKNIVEELVEGDWSDPL